MEPWQFMLDDVIFPQVETQLYDMASKMYAKRCKM